MGAKTGRTTLHDVFPPLVADLLRACRGWLRFLRLRPVLGLNREWAGRFQGERVYIIANGPSVATVDRGLFRGEKVITMNNFHRADWKHEVESVAHCFGEPPGTPGWLEPAECINGTSSASYWVNAAAYGHFKGIHPDKKLYYVLAGIEPSVWGKRSVDLTGLGLGFQTTAQLAIEVALFMGFKEIRLLGFDHDWLASPQFSKHFYSNERDPEDALGTFPYYDIIKSSLRMWEGYYALERAAASHGALIVNMTDGSFLDVFPRRPPRN